MSVKSAVIVINNIFVLMDVLFPAHTGYQSNISSIHSIHLAYLLYNKWKIFLLSFYYFIPGTISWIRSHPLEEGSEK